MPRQHPVRKTGGPRSCFKQNGAPKASFSSRRAAERSIPKSSVRLRAYECPKHGWHLGH